MARRFRAVVFCATLVLLGSMDAVCRAQDASPQSSATPSQPRRNFQNGNASPGDRERPFFKKGGGDLAQLRKTLEGFSPEERQKFFEGLTPEQRKKALDNYERWQNMTPEEKNMLREREAFRRQMILQEIDKSIAKSGLQLDKDTREMYILRYTQERRKIEEKLQKELEEKRKPLLEDMDNRLMEEFKAMPPKSAPTPDSSSPSPAASPTP